MKIITLNNDSRNVLSWCRFKLRGFPTDYISLACHFPQTSAATYRSYLFFWNRHWQGTFKEKWKKFTDNFFSWGITLMGQNGKTLTVVNIDFSQLDYSVWLLSILSRHSLIIIRFTRAMKHRQGKMMGIIICKFVNIWEITGFQSQFLEYGICINLLILNIESDSCH